MTLVHEHLYQSRDLSKINFSEYIHNLVYQIFQAYEIKARGVKFNVKVGPILLNIDTVVPCGLIPHFALQACYKHTIKEESALQPLLLLITINSFCNMYFSLQTI